MAGRSFVSRDSWMNAVRRSPPFVMAFAAGTIVMATLGSCDDDVSSTCQGEACGAGGGGAGDTIQGHCPESGVLYGPWALGFDETSALVRWDGCAPHVTEIMLEPEAGGDATTFSGEQIASDVRTTYNLIASVPPDLPGVYYRTEVSITGLSPSSCYRYTLAADSGRSGRFCTARAAGEPFRFLAIGDTNLSLADAADVFLHTLPDNPDFTIHLGDIQYYASIFESYSVWFPLMQPLLSAGAFMPCIGNHEVEENEFEFQDYYERLFGGAGFDSTSIDYYRFQSGGVWFFSISTEADTSPGSPQADWLEAQIADAAAKPGYRFGVVYFHKPMITLADYSQASSEREYFKPIFEQHRVKLVMQGHVHGYERFVDGAITYITSGGGGGALHDLDARIGDRPAEAALRVAAAKRYHAVVLDVAATELRARAISNDGVELDSFVIPLP